MSLASATNGDQRSAKDQRSERGGHLSCRSSQGDLLFSLSYQGEHLSSRSSTRQGECEWAPLCIDDDTAALHRHSASSCSAKGEALLHLAGVDENRHARVRLLCAQQSLLPSGVVQPGLFQRCGREERCRRRALRWGQTSCWGQTSRWCQAHRRGQE